jgi:hypothetical protein
MQLRAPAAQRQQKATDFPRNLAVLGIHPFLGRLFCDADDANFA